MRKWIILTLLLTCNYVYAAEQIQQTSGSEQESMPAQETQNASIPGAYNSIEVSDPSVQKAATFAVSQMQQGNLVKVDAAQMQVVAGKNYRLQLILEQSGVQYKYSVVVFEPLPNSGQSMQLTNVQAMGRL